MNAPITPELQREAVRIADSCMRSDIECYGVVVGELEDGRYSLVDDAGSEVALLELACVEIREAFAYLEARGLAVLEQDTHGHVIRLRIDSFTDGGGR